MPDLLNIKENYRWDLSGIEFALKERIGDPEKFIGRKQEMEFLYDWYQMIKRENGETMAFLGRRKIGKTLMMERLYNIIYSEKDGVIPFYYEFKEGKTSSLKFAEDFIVRFFMQVIAYYTRDISWTRNSMNQKVKYKIDDFIKKIKTIEFIHQDYVLENMDYYKNVLKEDQDVPYELIKLATSIPDAFASSVGIKENVVQIFDEFQYLNSEIDAGEEKILSKCYMSTAESKVAPLLVTGSLMGVLSRQLMKYTPRRFRQFVVPTMEEKESIAMTLNYGKEYGHDFNQKVAEYIVHITNNIPGRIRDLLFPATLYKPLIKSVDDVDEALYFEVDRGEIAKDWHEYLCLAMDRYNDKNLKRLTFFLCKVEGEFYYAKEIKKEMGLKIGVEKLRDELELLHKYDLIEKERGRYGGVYDPTLKKVLISNYGDILELDMKDFKEYFKTEDILTDLEKEIEKLELSLEEKEEYETKYKRVQGMYNKLKGEAYEREVLNDFFRLLKENKSDLVQDLEFIDLDFTLNPALESGKKLDIIIRSPELLLAIECKDYEKVSGINMEMVAAFIEKIKELESKNPDQEIIPLFLSRNGLREEIKDKLLDEGIRISLE